MICFSKSTFQGFQAIFASSVNGLSLKIEQHFARKPKAFRVALEKKAERNNKSPTSEAAEVNLQIGEKSIPIWQLVFGLGGRFNASVIPHGMKLEMPICYVTLRNVHRLQNGFSTFLCLE